MYVHLSETQARYLRSQVAERKELVWRLSTHTPTVKLGERVVFELETSELPIGFGPLAGILEPTQTVKVWAIVVSVTDFRRIDQDYHFDDETLRRSFSAGADWVSMGDGSGWWHYLYCRRCEHRMEVLFREQERKRRSDEAKAKKKLDAILGRHPAASGLESGANEDPLTAPEEEDWRQAELWAAGQ